MLIAVVSDTHRRRASISKVIEKIKEADVLIHLGDNVDDVEEIKAGFKGKILNIRGNCDFSLDAPSEMIETIEGKKIFMTHGHKYSVKYNMMDIKYKALELNADIVLYGHTHISDLNYNEGIWFINPGSAAMSRKGAESIAFISIEGDDINPRIVEI